MASYEKFLEKVIKHVKEKRLDLGLTQEDMMDVMSLRTYQNIERGVYDDIKLSSLFDIAERFNIKVSDLLDV